MTRLNYLVVVGLLGCQHQEPNYCPDVPVTHNCLDQDASVGSDGPTGCTGDTQCSGTTPVCDTGVMTCVQCTPGHASACSGTTPVCESDDTCHACSSHDQCSSDVCLPDGSCSDGTNVAYVDPAGSDNMNCTKASPCTKVAKALATTRPYIKFHGTTDEQVSINNRNVTLLADPAAKLTYTGGVGVILTIDGTSVVPINDLAIVNALGATGVGLSMPTSNTATVTLRRVSVTGSGGIGISASGGTLNMSQSTIATNNGGGISISNAQFTIVNNVIVANGSGAAGLGGIKIDSILTAGTHVLDFNTITANLGPTGLDTGVLCGTVLVPLSFDSDIVYGNIVAGVGTQIGGNAMCTTKYSDVGPDAAVGTGNINADPLFVNVAQSNYHIAATSPCKDAADPAASLTTDIDGDTRPQGGLRDIGADEYKP